MPVLLKLRRRDDPSGSGGDRSKPCGRALVFGRPRRVGTCIRAPTVQPLEKQVRRQNRCSAERDANDEHGRTQEEDDGRVDDRTPMAKLQVRGERDVSESATGTFASRCVSFERPADLLPDGARRGVRRQGRIRTLGLYSDTREGERRRNVSLAALLFTLRSVESRCRLPLFRRPSGRRARALINSSRRSSRAARF